MFRDLSVLPNFAWIYSWPNFCLGPHDWFCGPRNSKMRFLSWSYTSKGKLSAFKEQKLKLNHFCTLLHSNLFVWNIKNYINAKKKFSTAGFPSLSWFIKFKGGGNVSFVWYNDCEDQMTWRGCWLIEAILGKWQNA